MALFGRKHSEVHDARRLSRENEAERIRRIAAGDAEALESFYNDYFERLYRYIYYRVGRDHHHTEEVIHDTFMEAVNRAGEYDPARGSVESWLITHSRNRIRSNNNSVGRARDYEQSWSMLDGELDSIFARLDDVELPDKALENKELSSIIGAIMASLPEAYAKVLEMKYIANLPVKEIAKAMEKTEKAIESQLTRARTAFKEAFEVMAVGW